MASNLLDKGIVLGSPAADCKQPDEEFHERTPGTRWKWHGRSAHPGRTAQALPGHLRHHRFRRRTLSQLQPYERNGITLHTGDPVVEIDRVNRKVVSQSGLEVPYDRLLLATGSDPFIIPVPGSDLPGVVGFRDIADVDAMLEASKKYKKAAVIGGGLLGLEAANGLMANGMEVGADAEEVAGGAGHEVPHGGADRRGAGRCPCARVEIRRRFRAGSRPGGDGGGHPAQHRAGAKGRPLLRAGRGGERHPADLRSARLCRGRVRAAPRPDLWPGGAPVRTGQGGGQPPGAHRHRPLRGLGDTRAR